MRLAFKLCFARILATAAYFYFLPFHLVFDSGTLLTRAEKRALINTVFLAYSTIENRKGAKLKKKKTNNNKMFWDLVHLGRVIFL